MLDTVRWITAEGNCLSGPTPDIDWLPGKLRVIDQTRLPHTLAYLEITAPEALHAAICRLVVRGAPAIGCAAALGLAAAMQDAVGNAPAFLAEARRIADYLAGARPTAVNLAWALRRCVAALQAAVADGAQLPGLKHALVYEALRILEEDIAMCAAIGRQGEPLIREGLGVLTHCNAGALATGDHGTALAPLYAAHAAGRRFTVYADETRPLLQGARLTAWELQQAGLDVVLICDSMAAAMMQAGRIQLVIVGADRVAANGDTANKIGTYGVAVLARHHGIPLYVAMPYSTIDATLPEGSGIPIEERDPNEVRCVGTQFLSPPDVRVMNPAFDVTPHALIAGFITEAGLLRPPFAAGLKAAARRGA